MPVTGSKERTSEERQRHIRELQEKLQHIAGGPVPMGFSENCPEEIRERFLESVVAFEEAESVTLFAELTRMGLQMPAPEEMDDVQLNSKLWEVIGACHCWELTCTAPTISAIAICIVGCGPIFCGNQPC